MKAYLVVLLLCCASFTSLAQVSLNPEEGIVRLMSDYNKYDDREEYDKTDHEVIINFEAKNITVIEQRSGREVYNIDFLMHHDGTSSSVILQPGENLFMVRTDSIELCSYQDMFKAFSINFINKRTHSFMGLER
jgi:hypothetical protein